MPAFRKILIANRGEIALRIIRACRELSIATVAVYSDADRDALHVAEADEAYHLGPAPARQSYLDADKVLAVAARAGADALHPGYGFFAESAAFARRCTQSGLTFIGPSADNIEKMGGKIAARAAAERAGIPFVPGTTRPVRDADEVRSLGQRLGYPIAIKAAAGGGGKGLKVARTAGEVDRAIDLAAGEASAYFKDATLYVEKYLAAPKHVEVQLLGDRHGNVVHVGERDCSMQRRHQKLVEETPAGISAKLRSLLLDAVVKLARSIGYDSAGTVECLVEGDAFYFLEMNTRIQVEHTISEMVWGLDLVKAQIRVAAGERLWFSQHDLAPRGHAIECRINAESPAQDFRPHAGRIERYAEPGGPGVRIDAAAFPGVLIPEEYDSLLGKLITWGEDREEARLRMLRALAEYRIDGVDTTIPFLRLLLADDAFARDAYATPTVERFCTKHAADIAALYPARPPAAAATAAEPATLTVEVDDKRFVVRVQGEPAFNASSGARPKLRLRQRSGKRAVTDGPAVNAPMHGIVAEVRVHPGEAVAEGQVVAVIEAMKMMNEIVAHRAGTVAVIHARAGDTVEAGAPLLTLAEDPSSQKGM